MSGLDKHPVGEKNALQQKACFGVCSAQIELRDGSLPQLRCPCCPGCEHRAARLVVLEAELELELELEPAGSDRVVNPPPPGRAQFPWPEPRCPDSNI